MTPNARHDRRRPRIGPLLIRASSLALLIISTLFARYASIAAGAITYVQQQRSVSASALGDSQSFSAQDFAPFDRVANAQSTLGQGSSGRAEQHSSLDPWSIALSGSAQAHGTSGYAVSALTVQFDLDEPTTFTLTGHGSGTPNEIPDLRATIHLANDTVTLVDWQAGVGGTPEVLATGGTLAPGRYTLDVDFSAANAPGFTATNTYAATLLVPEPPLMSAALALALALRAATARRRHART